MTRRRATTTSLGMTLACCGLALALAAPAEAGGRGGRGGHGHSGHHGSFRSHGGHGSVGYRAYGHYRTSGRYYRHGGHGYYGGHRYSSHRGRGVYAPYVGVYGYYGGRSYAPRHVYSGYRAYRPYLPSPAFYQGYVDHLPYPVGHDPVYVDAAPVYEPAPAPSAAAPAQTIYIVLQPPPAAAPAAPAYEPADPEPPAVSAGGEPGRVHLAVEPAGAAVYLDDDLLGSGEEIARFEEPLALSSGVHVLEVLHPGHPPQRLVFGVPAAGELRVEVDLDGDRRGRKARVEALDHGPVEPGD